MDIFQITAQELLDSRGNPTVEATVHLDRYTRVSGMVPSGASTGKYEAVELRDNEPQRYRGKGVLKAVRNINGIIAPALIGHDVTDQRGIDQKMIELDGTENKSHLGANAILAVSIACLRAGAVARRMQFYEYVADVFGKPAREPFTMPIPLINVLNGGKHAIGSSDFQEYMIVPIGAPTFAEATRWAAETFHELKGIIRERGWPTTVGDEGGYAPPVESNEEPLKLIMQALERAGHTPGEDIAIALDPAASELYKDGKYHLTKEGMSLTSAEMVDLFVDWAGRYPIISIEDGLDEEDWDGFALLKDKTQNKVQIVGDDLFATNPQRVRIGIEKNVANCVLIKANQIGTITETLDTVHLALDNGLTAIVSHRSGETEMPFEADFGVGTGVGQVKIGSVSRSERVAEYNELMRIERHLGGRSILAHFPFTGVAKA
ncbi:MAG: phosphopyruvate hydratase [Sedimentisphaerales bacterium]|jgi:enolase|nr:phosphopyruvate hydratase [Sedimentisphaerales bacterium]HNY79781.1 phosphopyruvate hydratase [Sedimentisphaerales bacterium]HOC62241.1 phosphopyruvate hydratase [Sedimentisphaerales bacterium]HOH63118.1 phosphopyruvate hydratase [Sedimentisphaerales bacterium]HQA91093.1 phosphopyruvate hydratase [Sedimentisphaerales bacterium]